MTYQQLFARIQTELGKMERAVCDNNEFIAALETVELPSTYNAVIGGISMNLQGLYTGAERIFMAIAQDVDGTKPEGDQWHQSLLTQMSTNFGEIRPSVISHQTFEDLEEFLRFRHVVRSAYSHQLDTNSVLKNAARLPQCFKNLSDDCEALQRSLNEGSLHKGIDSGV
jgi:hypothetical protein